MKKPKQSKKSLNDRLTEVYSVALSTLVAQLLIEDAPLDKDIYNIFTQIQDVTWEYQYAIYGFALISAEEKRKLRDSKGNTK